MKKPIIFIFVISHTVTLTQTYQLQYQAKWHKPVRVCGNTGGSGTKGLVRSEGPSNTRGPWRKSAPECRRPERAVVHLPAQQWPKKVRLVKCCVEMCLQACWSLSFACTWNSTLSIRHLHECCLYSAHISLLCMFGSAAWRWWSDRWKRFADYISRTTATETVIVFTDRLFCVDIPSCDMAWQVLTAALIWSQ